MPNWIKFFIKLVISLGLIPVVLAGEQTINSQPANKVETLPSQTLPAQSLPTQLQAVKSQIMQLNRDLFVLEEDLLFPASTQLGVFVSMDAGVLLSLDNIEIQLDDKKIVGHLYTERQVDAIQRGALQRVYEGNLKSGEHKLRVIITGTIGADKTQQQDYRRAIEYSFNKAADPVWLEVQVQDDAQQQQPKLEVKAWSSAR